MQAQPHHLPRAMTRGLRLRRRPQQPQNSKIGGAPYHEVRLKRRPFDTDCWDDGRSDFRDVDAKFDDAAGDVRARCVGGCDKGRGDVQLLMKEQYVPTVVEVKSSIRSHSSNL